MKKFYLWVMLAVCFLTACSNDAPSVSGKVINTQMDGGRVVSLLLEQDDGTQIHLQLNEDTVILSPFDEATAEQFQAGTFTDVIVWAEYAPSQKGANTVTFMHFNRYLTDETVTLEDGMTLNVWRDVNSAIYVLPNGVELLFEEEPYGSESSYVMGEESFDNLTLEAQTQVSAFYDQQGTLYDLAAALELVYTNYLEQADSFSLHRVGQNTSLVASNETVLYFLTTVNIPIDSNYFYEHQFCNAFDRNTGEVIPMEALFTCQIEDIIPTLAEIAGIDNPVLVEEMTKAFMPEYLVFFPTNLNMTFPAGTLPSQPYSYGWGFDYDADLATIVQPWAIPFDGIEGE